MGGHGVFRAGATSPRLRLGRIVQLVFNGRGEGIHGD
jgi:hypothetical protein